MFSVALDTPITWEIHFYYNLINFFFNLFFFSYLKNIAVCGKGRCNVSCETM